MNDEYAKAIVAVVTRTIIDTLRDMSKTEYMDMKSGPDALRTAAKAFEEALEVTTL